MSSTPPDTLPFTGDEAADRLLATDPLALLVGMLLDQQVPMEWAFSAPKALKERLGGTLDAPAVAAMDPDDLVAVFCEKPALHRYPAAMARRTHDLARHIVDEYAGRPGAVWRGAATGEELFARVRGLPGFGEQKARIFVALLAKRLGVQPPGWEDVAGAYGRPGYFSVADVDGPDALARVREHKKAVKAEAKATRAGSQPRAGGGRRR